VQDSAAGILLNFCPKIPPPLPSLKPLNASVKDDRAKENQPTKIQSILSDNLRHLKMISDNCDFLNGLANN
jgi:hypothetical protein